MSAPTKASLIKWGSLVRYYAHNASCFLVVRVYEVKSKFTSAPVTLVDGLLPSGSILTGVQRDQLINYLVFPCEPHQADDVAPGGTDEIEARGYIEPSAGGLCDKRRGDLT